MRMSEQDERRVIESCIRPYGVMQYLVQVATSSMLHATSIMRASSIGQAWSQALIQERLIGFRRSGGGSARWLRRLPAAISASKLRGNPWHYFLRAPTLAACINSMNNSLNMKLITSIRIYTGRSVLSIQL